MTETVAVYQAGATNKSVEKSVRLCPTCGRIKSRSQEDTYHMLFDEAAKRCKHLNREFDKEGWKRLLVDQFARDMLADPQCPPEVRENLSNGTNLVPSLDGRGVVQLGIQTRNFRKKTASLFIDYLHAFLATEAK